jgi:quinol monooxygenase YgiN
MFVVTVTFETAPDDAAAFLTRVRRQAADSLRDEPGCHRFDVCTDAEGLRVFLYEIYTDRPAFQEHLETPHYKAFNAEVGPIVRYKTVETWVLAS